MFPDIPSIIVGLVVGGVAVALVVEVMGRGREPPRTTAKLTTGWRLSEMDAPVVVARDVVDLDVPKGARVFASGVVAPDVLKQAKVQRVPTVRAEFALDRKARRVLMFLGGARDGAMALLTVDEAMVQRLDNEARTLEDRGGAYVERHRIQDLPGREGVVVETNGIVRDVLPFRERFMIRLSDGDDVIGVLVDKDPERLRDERIQVRGRLVKDAGYASIDAEDIRIMR